MTPAATPPWQWDLARAADRLGRWFEGRLVLSPGPDDLVVPAVQLLTDDAALLRLIRSSIPADLPPLPPGHADRRTDPRILASRFARLYSNATTGAALIALACGVGLDLSPASCSIVFRGPVAGGVALDIAADRIVRCAERPAAWPVGGPCLDTVGELRAYVWTRYYGEHIAPLFSRIAELTNVSPKLLWSNSAEMAGLVGDSAEEYLDPAEATPFLADSRALLDAEQLPGVPGGNPMRHRLEWTPYDDGSFPREVQLRRMCCLVLYLADRYGRLCQNCPHLPIDERVALIRERHGLSQSDPRGPAEQQAINRGLAWLGRRACSTHTEEHP
jgi:hypothetical protein